MEAITPTPPVVGEKTDRRHGQLQILVGGQEPVILHLEGDGKLLLRGSAEEFLMGALADFLIGVLPALIHLADLDQCVTADRPAGDGSQTSKRASERHQHRPGGRVTLP
ncbi:hypothetical protein AB0K74_21680 [Streptomyces sp. NPDC056159]|uniref:hypothetical protein n=1 Tax=unclassified Streptomyces TaxID=2593676 RepID=UPI003418D554